MDKFYCNGRKAKINDIVTGRDSNGVPFNGVVTKIHDTADHEACNLELVSHPVIIATCSECVHVDDIAPDKLTPELNDNTAIAPGE